MSFFEIMREQEEERMVRQLHKLEETFWDQPMEMAKKLSLEDVKIQNPHENTTKNVQLQLDEDLAYAQQFRDDESLAYYLQKQERCNVSYDQSILKKALTPLEEKLYNLQFGIDESKQSEPDEEETEYNYTEPFQVQPNLKQIEPPILYDPAQRKEDKEIAHVTKRMVEKRINASPVALHHKSYTTRNKGKALFHQEQRPKVNKSIVPKISSSTILTQDEVILPLRDENHDYGLVKRVLGNTRFIVFCYWNGSEKICRMTGKMKYRRIWIGKGDIVLLKLRNYQDSKADIVYRYTNDNYQLLLKLGELKECNPKNWLPADLIHKILNYLDRDAQINVFDALELPQEFAIKNKETKTNPDTNNNSFYEEEVKESDSDDGNYFLT